MNDLFEVVITAIVQKDGKFLILQRSASKKRFPNRWTVPGGHLETADFINEPKDTAEYWYNVLEKALAREVKEEAGFKIKNVRYVTSLATVHKDGAPSFVISCLADYDGGKVKLQSEECQDHAWVNLEEAKGYDLIDGIYDELAMAADVAAGRTINWQRSSN
ncbi:NUDIX domain-containing protein [Candidatus Saccharibacteria bacterium]|nr:NUDIX domain-containing protein [Candidatus Saccharibacteria bacterium]